MTVTRPLSDVSASLGRRARARARRRRQHCPMRVAAARTPPPSRQAQAPPRKRNVALLAAAGIASVGVPGMLLMRQMGSGAACSSRTSAEDSAALRALALVAQRNAVALRELVSERRDDPIDAGVLQAIEHAIHGEASSSRSVGSSGGGSGSSSSSAAAASSSSSSSSSSSAITRGGGSGHGSDGTAAPHIWLRFALVSIARRGHTDYLLRALHSIFEQLPADPWHPLHASTDVVVINNHEPPEAHTVFHHAAQLHSDRATFITKSPPQPPLACPAGRGNSGGARPKPQVQRQSCDLVAAFRALMEVRPMSAHVLLLEDDWLLCPHGMAAIQHAMDKAYAYDKAWLALRVSYGFNGVIVPTADLPSLTDHLAAHFARRPPDHLLFEWFSGERADTRCAAARAAAASAAARAAAAASAAASASAAAPAAPASVLQAGMAQLNFHVPRVHRTLARAFLLCLSLHDPCPLAARPNLRASPEAFPRGPAVGSRPLSRYSGRETPIAHPFSFFLSGALGSLMRIGYCSLSLSLSLSLAPSHARPSLPASQGARPGPVLPHLPPQHLPPHRAHQHTGTADQPLQPRMLRAYVRLAAAGRGIQRAPVPRGRHLAVHRGCGPCASLLPTPQAAVQRGGHETRRAHA